MKEKVKLVAFNKHGARVFVNPDEATLQLIDDIYDDYVINPDLSEVNRTPLTHWVLSEGKIIKGENEIPLREKKHAIKEVEKIVEVIKEVPVEVIKEVEKIVEIIKHVPVEVIKEVPVVQELTKEVIKTVEIPIYRDKEVRIISEKFKVLCIAQAAIILILSLLLVYK